MNLIPANIKTEVLTTLNETVSAVISSKDLDGFNRAYAIASAVEKLKAALTPEYMKPIMALQGNRLGFKTDKDDEGGYPEHIVKNCLIEAVLTGVQPFGNQFNIIGGNCYITKEGFGHLLAKFPGLTPEIIPQLPRIKDGSAAIVMKIKWTLSGKSEEVRDIDFPIRLNKFMGTDAVIGKGTRKARAWLFHHLTGIEVGDGDVNDVDATVLSSKIGNGSAGAIGTSKTKEDVERERIVLMINECKTVQELEAISKQIPDSLLDLYTVKHDELKSKA